MNTKIENPRIEAVFRRLKALLLARHMLAQDNALERDLRKFVAEAFAEEFDDLLGWIDGQDFPAKAGPGKGFYSAIEKGYAQQATNEVTVELRNRRRGSVVVNADWRQQI